MISFKSALSIHSILIEQFGGADGIRDEDLLDSALKRPFQTFDGVDLYLSTIEKAAAIIESVVKNHPFIDGNKRTGYVLARLIMMNDNLDIEASQDEKYSFVIKISEGKVDYEEIKYWLQNHSKQSPDFK